MTQKSLSAEEIVLELAAWSKKYPRGTIYGFSQQIDEQLIAIEEKAKEYASSFKEQDTQDTDKDRLKWISVNERLPEERQGYSHSIDVNILLRDVKMENQPLFVSTGSYQYLGIKKWCEYLYGNRVDNGDFEVIAWQPLPKPPTAGYNAAKQK